MLKWASNNLQLAKMKRYLTPTWLFLLLNFPAKNLKWCFYYFSATWLARWWWSCWSVIEYASIDVVSQWNVRFVQRNPHGCAVPRLCFCKGKGKPMPTYKTQMVYPKPLLTTQMVYKSANLKSIFIQCFHIIVSFASL